MSDDSTADTDYGDVNFESILQGNFTVQSVDGDGERVGRYYDESADVKVTNNSNLRHGDLPRDKEIMHIMNEFNILMKEIGEDVSDHSKNEISSNYQQNNHSDAANAYIESQLMQNDVIQNKNLNIGTVGSKYGSGHDNYESINERITYAGKDNNRNRNSTSSSYAATAEDDYLRIEKKIIDFVRREDNGEVETNPKFLMLAAHNRRRPDTTTTNSILRNNRDTECKPEIQNPVSNSLGWLDPLNKDEFDSLRHLAHDVGNRRDHRVDSSTRSSIDSVDSEDSLILQPPSTAAAAALFDVEDRDAVLLRSSHNSAVDWSSSSTSTQPYNVLSSVKDALHSRTPTLWMTTTTSSSSTRGRDDSHSNAPPNATSSSTATASIEDMRSSSNNRRRNDTNAPLQSKSVKLLSTETERERERAARTDATTRSASPSLLDLYRDGGARTATTQPQPPQPQSQSQSVDSSKRVSFQQQQQQQQQHQVRLSSSYSDSSFLLPGPKQEADFDERKFQAGEFQMTENLLRNFFYLFVHIL